MRELLSDNTEAVDAELVVSELVTNAWKHGTGDDPITLTARLGDGGLRIEVCGAARGEPARQADSDSAGGRGLLLIDELVETWGFERRDNVVCVWAQIPLA